MGDEEKVIFLCKGEGGLCPSPSSMDHLANKMCMSNRINSIVTTHKTIRKLLNFLVSQFHANKISPGVRFSHVSQLL